jgi:Fe2+ or Zn2+ uptake regulation protein
MKLFKKLLCLHKWKTHTKKVYNWTEKVEGTWDKIDNFSQTHEILICKRCGKIKKITY